MEILGGFHLYVIPDLIFEYIAVALGRPEIRNSLILHSILVHNTGIIFQKKTVILFPQRLVNSLRFFSYHKIVQIRSVPFQSMLSLTPNSVNPIYVH